MTVDKASGGRPSAAGLRNEEADHGTPAPSPAGAAPTDLAPEAIALLGVSVIRNGRALLDDIYWTVQQDERWAVLGPNGSGKTTMLQVASSYLGPTRGTVRLLGETYGKVDVRDLRPRIGYAGSAPAQLVRSYLPALEIVVTGRHASFVPERWHDYSAEDWEFASYQLDRLDAARLGDRPFGLLSTGEKQRVLIARSLMTNPEVLFLDEATSGLDLGAREELVASLGALASDPSSPAVVLVTHHVEEIPAGFGHLIMLAEGRVLAAGPVDKVLTPESLSACFGQPLRLERRDGRYTAWRSSSFDIR